MKATKWKSRRPENAELVLFLFRHSWPFVVVCESPSVELWVVRVAVCIYMGSIATLLLLTLPEQSRDNSCVEASNKQLNVERKTLKSCGELWTKAPAMCGAAIWTPGLFQECLHLADLITWPGFDDDYVSKSSLVSLSRSLILKLCQHIDSSLAGWWARQESWGMKRKHWQPVEAIKNPQSVLGQSKSRPWQRMVGNQKHPSAIKRHPFSAIGLHTHTKTTGGKDKRLPPWFSTPKITLHQKEFSSIFCKRIPY